MPDSVAVTILQDKRDSQFVIVSDDGTNVGDRYATLEEADKAARAWAYEQSRTRRGASSRVPQRVIEEMLLNGDNKPYARLLASEAWPAFEAWLDAEDVSTAEKTSDVLEAIMRFSAVIISGMAHEHWPANEKVRAIIQRLAARRLKAMMEVER
jgi:hypothetical protein